MNTSGIISNTRGFTLIELAIVLVIIGVLVGSFIGTIGARIDTTRRAEAVAELDDIKRVILGYAYSSAANPTIPCPDCDAAAGCGTPDDGIEDRDGPNGNCLTATGNLPWVTLGLGRSDTWDTRYRYWVDTTFANQTPFFNLTDNANGVIRTRTPGGAALVDIADNAAAVVFTYGKNTYGGVSNDDVARPPIPVANVDETENADGDATFVRREITGVGATTAGGEFDDIVIWLPEYELKASMVEALKLP